MIKWKPNLIHLRSLVKDLKRLEKIEKLIKEISKNIR